MGFSDIPKVENSKFYVNLAFKYANERADIAREKLSRQRSVIEKSKIVEIEKLRAVNEFLNRKLRKIIKDFPNIGGLSSFYEEILKCYIDTGELRKSLGSLNWAAKKISEFFLMYKKKIAGTKSFDKVNECRRMFYGRVSSAMKQVDKNLKIIEEARFAMRNFPTIKENIFTVAIAGFPNVGKSTLLSKISTSKPEIAEYAFTTKSLNIGYVMKNGKREIQMIDAPGTLNRFEKMNEIEKQAYIAMKHAADAIVFVFDPTETYPAKAQEKLLKKIRADLKKRLIIYISKTDIAETSRKGIRNPDELKEKLLAMADKGNSEL